MGWSVGPFVVQQTFVEEGRKYIYHGMIKEKSIFS